MGALLALVSSLAWGCADFVAGIATRRVGALRVLSVSYPAGAIPLTLAAAFLIPGVIDADTVAWGLAVGLVGILAMYLFYRALAAGPMGLVSPITAVLSAAIPVITGLVLGETLAALAIAGMVLAVIAVILVSVETGEERRVTPQALGWALGAGVAIGLYITGVGLSPDDSGLWVVTLGRWFGVALLCLIVLIGLRRLPWTGLSVAYPWAFVIASGVLDATANGIFQIAARLDDLAIVGLIASLYPAATVVLARVFLSERMSRVQLVGVMLALVAVAALTVSG
ncbi:MAG: DMT family transporter [bacterium]